MNARKTLSTACAVALLFTLASPLFAKQPDTVRSAAAPPVINASEDYAVNYPGGTPPASVSDALDGDDSTYNRTLGGDCTQLSGAGVDVRYDTITLTNTGASTASVNLEIECGGDDGFLTAYNGSFNPAAPTANCIVNDDDTVDFCPSLTGVSVPAGQTVVFVVSEFEPGAMDAWTAVFTGTTPVSLQNFKVD